MHSYSMRTCCLVVLLGTVGVRMAVATPYFENPSTSLAWPLMRGNWQVKRIHQSQDNSNILHETWKVRNGAMEVFRSDTSMDDVPYEIHDIMSIEPASNDWAGHWTLRSRNSTDSKESCIQVIITSELFVASSAHDDCTKVPVETTNIGIVGCRSRDGSCKSSAAFDALATGWTRHIDFAINAGALHLETKHPQVPLILPLKARDRLLGDGSQPSPSPAPLANRDNLDGYNVFPESMRGAWSQGSGADCILYNITEKSMTMSVLGVVRNFQLDYLEINYGKWAGFVRFHLLYGGQSNCMQVRLLKEGFTATHVALDCDKLGFENVHFYNCGDCEGQNCNSALRISTFSLSATMIALVVGYFLRKAQAPNFL